MIQGDIAMLERNAFLPAALAAILCLLSTGCGPGADPSAESGKAPAGTGEPKRVHTVNYPLAYFAERISGGDVKVIFPAPADGDPAFWTPDDRTIAAYQTADLILMNGASYAKWADTVSLPASRTVDTSAGFKDQYLVIEETVTHSHGPEGKHDHAGTDFNTWVDPHLAALQAGAVCGALVKLRPDRATEFEANARALNEDLTRLYETLKSLCGQHASPPLVASHPVYNYVARRFGWNLKSVQWEPEEMPSDAEWGKLAELLKTHPARHMIWEGPPAPEIATKLKKDHGLDSVVFEPCGNRPEEGDYLSVMKRNVEQLKVAFARP